MHQPFSAVSRPKFTKLFLPLHCICTSHTASEATETIYFWLHLLDRCRCHTCDVITWFCRATLLHNKVAVCNVHVAHCNSVA